MKRTRRSDRLDDAARAGWLYYVAGKTQDEIAVHMGVSRQAAQRLVSLAVSEKLIRVWLDHPIARCMELAAALVDRFDLRQAEVVPNNPDSDDDSTGLAEAGAAEIQKWLRLSDPQVVAVGTGRTMKAMIETLPPISCPQHRIVSLAGNIGPDGAAAYYNVIFSMGEVVEARHFPFPLPVFVASAGERALLHQQALIRTTLDLAASSNVAFVGVGEMDESAPLFLDGFLSRRELSDLRAQGAVGEICGWIYDNGGSLLGGGANERTASPPIPDRNRATVVALAKGRRKHQAITSAIKGGLVNGLVTDEATAEALLGSA